MPSSMRTISVGDWDFHLSESNGSWNVSVPDCGGMADMVPKDAAQLAWAAEQFAQFPWLNASWPTVWDLPADRVAELESFLASAAGSRAAGPRH